MCTRCLKTIKKQRRIEAERKEERSELKVPAGKVAGVQAAPTINNQSPKQSTGEKARKEKPKSKSTKK